MLRRLPCQAYFTLVLIVVLRLSETKAVKDTSVSSFRNKATLNGSHRQEFKCGWSCKVNESDLNTKIHTAFKEEKLPISLSFGFYLKKVEEQCANQILYNSNGEKNQHWFSSHWIIWLVNNKLPSSVNNAIQRFSSLFFPLTRRWLFIEANCTLNVKSANSHNLHGVLSPDDHFEGILRQAVDELGRMCTTELELNEQTCIQIRERAPIEIFAVLFMMVFTYIAPAVVCLFGASEVTYKGVRYIPIRGPTPMGFRSLIGNYFFSTDHTMRQIVRKGIMRAVILPIPVLVPVIFLHYLLYKTGVREGLFLFRSFWVLCCGCYFIQAFYFEFFNRTVTCVECTICHKMTKKTYPICLHRELPQGMLVHVFTILALMVAFLVAFWDVITFVYQTIQNCLIAFFSWAISVSTFREVAFVVSLLVVSGLSLVGLYETFDFWYYTILTPVLTVFSMVPGAFIFLFPIATLIQWTSVDLWQSLRFLHRYLPPFVSYAVSLFVVLLDICVCCLAAIGVTTVLMYAAVGIMILLQLAVSFVLSKENLPIVTCCVLFYFYLWNSYRSFTRKYENLAATLFEQYKQLPHGEQRINRNKDSNMPDTTAEHTKDRIDFFLTKLSKQFPESLRNMFSNFHIHFDSSPDFCRTTANVKRIPKNLFNTACEELMPLRKSICMMMLKAILIGTFIFFVFCFTMMLNCSHVTATLVTFVAGLFPGILIICDERRVKRNFDTVFTEKVQLIAKKYVNIRFPCYQGGNYHDYVTYGPGAFVLLYISFISFLTIYIYYNIYIKFF